MIEQPAIPIPKAIEDIKLLNASQARLKNGIPVYFYHDPAIEVVKLELVFRAGRWFEHKPLLAQSCAKMLKRGTRHNNARQLSEAIEQFGASIKMSAGFDYASMHVFSLHRYLSEVLSILLEILREANFPEDEWDTFKRIRKQRLLIEEEKTEYLADRQMRIALFGQQHPYGYPPSPQAYDALQREDLLRFFKSHFHPGNCLIFAAGKMNDHSLRVLDTFLGQGISTALTAPGDGAHKALPAREREHRHNVKGAVQSSIRMSKRSIPKTHPDYYDVFFLNLLFGGYFGSRLMSNIREDKGYTYGIYSVMSNLLFDNFIYISTEADNSYTEKVLTEIYREMDRLVEGELVQDEVDVVRNYLMGNLLKSIDGPFKNLNTFRNLILYGQQDTDFDQFIEHIKNIKADDVIRAAGKYLLKEEYYIRIAG